jgi:aspartokinase
VNGKRIEVGGLMERGDVCLVEVLGFDWRPGQACGILGKFGQASISLSYLSIGNGPDGDKNMSFCVNTARLAGSREILDEIKEQFQPTKVEVRGPMVILTLYGPHFSERTSLASEVFSALCAEGINAQTVCSSINSISVVADTLDRDKVVACLKEKFSWPE